jgi:GNAT acetyltransferase-like protein
MRLLRKHEILDLLSGGSATSTTANPFATREWTRHFISQVAEEDWIFALPESPSEIEYGLLYLRRNRSRSLAALTNYYASLFSPIVRVAPDRLASAVETLVDEITQHRPCVDTVNLSPLASDAPETIEIEAALRRRRWHVRRHFCFGNWYLPCAGVRYTDYIAGRPSEVQNTIARKGRKFATTPGNRIEIISAEADVERAIAAFQRVYSRSWKNPEPYPDFVPGWARICASRGWLRVGLAWIGETPIAAQFWFTMGDRAYIYKLAHDEQFQSWSAGTLLTAELLRHSLDQDRVIEVDYLTGDDPYKRAWMSDRRERAGIFASNLRTPWGLLSAGREYVAAGLQRLRRDSASA